MMNQRANNVESKQKDDQEMKPQNDQNKQGKKTTRKNEGTKNALEEQ